jgi:hypothetical protein
MDSSISSWNPLFIFGMSTPPGMVDIFIEKLVATNIMQLIKSHLPTFTGSTALISTAASRKWLLAAEDSGDDGFEVQDGLSNAEERSSKTIREVWASQKENPDMGSSDDFR